jgi:uncharacterized protein YegP (UPF0339 family)
MKLDIYKAADGWRWRFVAENGRIIAESGEAYTRNADAERAFATAQAGIAAFGKREPTPTTFSE